MPITKWTYLIACWAIAGFPWASGFYSKDEILWKAFTQEGMAFPFLGMTPHLGQLIYLMGIITATGTSFYMFRSYYMTFTGDYRGHADANGHGHDDGHGHGHGHRHEPKESPLSITAPILEHWLEPALPAVVNFAEAAHSTEFIFQLIGVSAGAVGWIFARALYKDNQSKVPAQLLERWKAAWTVVYNKYYVDEFYQATLLRGSVAFAHLLSWLDKYLVDGLVNLAGAIARVFAELDGAIDRYLVDGAVNLVADSTLSAGRILRRVQTGRIQTYLYGALAGAIAIVLINFLLK
jgi:NADH-quinone oxidoreductase subunit L